MSPGNISFAMPEPIRRERKTTRSGSIIAAMNPRTMKKQEEEDRTERIEVPYLCPIVLRKEVISLPKIISLLFSHE